MTSSPAGYIHLFEVYDRWQESYGEDYSRRVLPRILRTIEDHAVSHGRAIDLGCGTGTLALLIEKEGWHVTGIDASPGMIEAARAKAREDKSACAFFTQDIRSFVVDRPANLALSVYDVLNHIPTEDDLFKAFQRIHCALLPDGLFIFDVNNEQCFRRLWTKSESLRLRDFTMEIVNSYDRKKRHAISEVRVAFSGKVEELFEKVDEWCYSPRVIRRLLSAAGFTVLEAEDFAFPGNLWAGKLKTWWVAKARSSFRLTPMPRPF